MPTRTVRTLALLAALGWLVVGGYGLREIIVEDAGDYWEISYGIFTGALMLGALFTVATVWNASRPCERPVLRSCGLAVCAVGLVSTFVAWALPLWMTILAIGYALVALAGAKPWRRPVAFLAGAQLLGLVAMIVAIEAEVGRPDEYGDYPAAFGIGLVVTAVATVASIYELHRSVNDRAPSTVPTRGTAASLRSG